jgi:adenosylcobinamide kinase/adenosylcobinamide-phosphate guanylyltransferase
VSDFIYSDAFIYDEFTENYRKSLAYIDRQCAQACDIVLEAYAGNIIAHKGSLDETAV